VVRCPEIYLCTALPAGWLFLNKGRGTKHSRIFAGPLRGFGLASRITEVDIVAYRYVLASLKIVLSLVLNPTTAFMFVSL
jgi:hypothetical protein